MKRIYLFVLIILFFFQGCIKLEDLILTDPYYVWGIGLGDCSKIKLSGDKLYVLGSYYDRIGIADVSDPCSTYWIVRNELLLPTSFVDIELKGSICFGIGGDGVYVVDLSSYTYNPISHLSLSSIPREINIVDNRCFVASESSFYVIDISSPESLKILGEIKDTFGYIQALGSSEKNCVIVSDKGLLGKFLYVIDVSNSSNPTIKSSRKIESDGYNYAEIYGNYVFATATSGLLYSFDISDPTRPKFLQAIDVIGAYYEDTEFNRFATLEVHIDYPFAFVCAESPSFVIVDISNPRDLKYVGGENVWNSPGLGRSMAISEQYAFVACWSMNGGGIYTFRVRY